MWPPSRSSMSPERCSFGAVSGLLFTSQLSNRDEQSEASPTSNNDYAMQTQPTEADTINIENQMNLFNPTGCTFPYKPNTALNDLLREVACKYEIQESMAQRLRALQDYEIVIVCDDSGSMMTPVNGTELTRWHQLCSIVKIVLEISTIFDSNGVDIFFLNRPAYLNIKNPSDVDEAFSKCPSGFTPLATTLKYIFQLPPSRRGQDKKLLVFVATDGASTDNNGTENMSEFERVMRKDRQIDTTYVTFLLCTDDPIYVECLNRWDRTMDHVDVIDDFHTERNQIRSYRGSNYPFSLGDYVVKALIGAIDPEIDALDEPDETDNLDELISTPQS